MTNPSRRQQPAISIRSAKAVARLALLTRGGRSQAEIVEEALERMPLPPSILCVADRVAGIEAITAKGRTLPRRSQAEVDAEMWDENGLPR